MIHIMLSANAPKVNIPNTFPSSPISWNPRQTPISLPEILSSIVESWLYLQPSFLSIDLQHFPSIYVSVQSRALPLEYNTFAGRTWIKFNKHKTILVLMFMLTLISVKAFQCVNLGHFQTYSCFAILSFDIETHEQMIDVLRVKAMK